MKVGLRPSLPPTAYCSYRRVGNVFDDRLDLLAGVTEDAVASGGVLPDLQACHRRPGSGHGAEQLLHEPGTHHRADLGRLYL